MKLLKLFAAGVVALAACSCGNAQVKTYPPAEADAKAPAVTVLAAGEQLPAVDKLPMVIDFNATWCGPCRKFAPIFDAAAEKYADRASFYSVDVDKHPALAAQYEVRSIPTIAFLMPDGTVTVAVGFMDTAQFQKALTDMGIAK